MILDPTMVEPSGGCAAWRSSIETGLDGEEAPDGTSAGLDAHLLACGGCRAYQRDLRRIRDGLRSVPLHPLPPASLRHLRAIAHEGDDARLRYRAFAPARVRAAMAAAAVLMLAAAAIWFVNDGPGAAPSEAELAQIDRDLQVVLARLGDALASAERIAVDDVLIGGTAPLIRRLPLSRLEEPTLNRRPNP